MKIRLKFFASFAAFLPAGAKDNIADIEVAEGTTVHRIFERYGVPKDQAQIVLINGMFVAMPERDTRVLAEGETLAAWPAVAGG